MSVEIAAAIQSLRVVNDLVQANRSFRNFNELVGAVAEVNAKLAAAWSVTLTSQEKQAALSQRVGELEKEIAELKNWKREAERYQLVMVAIGATAYAMKPGMENNEPPHYLCANCFTKGEKSILQSESAGTQVYTYCCPRCQSKLPVAVKSVMVPIRR